MHITMTVSDNNLKSFIAAYIHLSTRVALHHMKRDKNPLKEKQILKVPFNQLRELQKDWECLYPVHENCGNKSHLYSAVVLITLDKTHNQAFNDSNKIH